MTFLVVIINSHKKNVTGILRDLIRIILIFDLLNSSSGSLVDRTIFVNKKKFKINFTDSIKFQYFYVTIKT